MLRWAAAFDPFDFNKRGASANFMAIVALRSKDYYWLKAAQTELSDALRVDYTDANLLQHAIAVSLFLHDDKQAQIYYDQFKRVNKGSPLLALVRQHQQGSRAVAADP